MVVPTQLPATSPPTGLGLGLGLRLEFGLGLELRIRVRVIGLGLRRVSVRGLELGFGLGNY